MRPIDGDVLKRKAQKVAVESWKMKINANVETILNQFIDWIDAAPTIEPEIIHCRDCRWRNDQNGSTAWLPCRAIVTPSDFYCGRAERRTG